jgi:hypothetical protein
LSNFIRFAKHLHFQNQKKADQKTNKISKILNKVLKKLKKNYLNSVTFSLANLIDQNLID